MVTPKYLCFKQIGCNLIKLTAEYFCSQVSLDYLNTLISLTIFRRDFISVRRVSTSAFKLSNSFVKWEAKHSLSQSLPCPALFSRLVKGVMLKMSYAKLSSSSIDMYDDEGLCDGGGCM